MSKKELKQYVFIVDHVWAYQTNTPITQNF